MSSYKLGSRADHDADRRARLAFELRDQGRTQMEIAAATGFSQSQISLMFRQDKEAER
jgi:predicted transcriptional regulator